jgi:simple sugar transport system ATP-binding protein
VDGNGQSELIEAIVGLRAVESGKIYLGGQDITSRSIGERIRAGMGNIPEDRQRNGLVLDFRL